MTPFEIVGWAGLVLGLLFGAVGQWSGFCLHRGLQEAWHGRPQRKLRSFSLALALAVIGTQAIFAVGLVDLSSTFYLTPVFSWVLVPLGGVLFGVGMTLCNGCGARALVLLGQGNLRALLVVLCIGVAGYATLTGVLAPLRVQFGELTAFEPAAWALGKSVPTLVVACVAVLLLLGHAFWRGELRHSPRDLLAGILIGLMIPAGWLITGWLGADDFDPVPVVSLTFVAPIGEAIQYLMISTGMSLRFGGVMVFGTLAGSLMAALATRSFHWQGFESPQQMRRFILGGVAMGVGGALAMGCSIGQGLSGLSTLALASVLAAGGIVLGSRLATRGEISARVSGSVA